MNIVNGIALRLGCIGYAVVGQTWKTNLLATPFNRLYLIESGTGVLSTAHEELVLEPGKAYLLPADLPCSYHCNGRLSLLYFHFNLTRPDQFDLISNYNRLAAVDFPSNQLSQLKDICKKSSYTDAYEIICAINHIVLSMNRIYGMRWNDTPTYSTYVLDTIAEINRNLSAQLRIDNLVQHRFVSRSYLERQFHKEVGLTIKQYINMQLINTAQWKLGNTDDSIEKISNDLGFCNQFYFSKYFKKQCRVSPLQYKKGTKL